MGRINVIGKWRSTFLSTTRNASAHMSQLYQQRPNQHTALARVGCKAVQHLFVDLSVDTGTIAVTRQAVQH